MVPRVDSLAFYPAQRRKLLIWGWGSVTVVLIGVAGIVANRWVNGLGLLFLPGAVALVVAPLTLSLGYGRTVLSPRGIRTRGISGRRACRWPDVAGIDAVTVRGSRGSKGIFVVVTRTSGKKFRLAAPFDSDNGRDPQFRVKYGQIHHYWTEMRVQVAEQR